MSGPTPDAESRFQIAIVGSGPSGFYAADALLKSDLPVSVDVYERLAAPFGLVRYGVAPDHPRLKSTIKVFERIAQHDYFKFVGNVEIEQDLALEDLRRNYDAVILTHGSRRGRALDIPGGSLDGCHTATDFVGWYNGHPDYADLEFNFESRSAAIIGNGNVALDIARMLVQPIDVLRQTDIATHAVDALAASKIREVHVIGRRGPAQASFTNMELRELGEIPGVAPVVDKDHLISNAATREELADKKNFLTCKNLEHLRSFAESIAGDDERRVIFHFLRSPMEANGSNSLESLTLSINRLEGDPFTQRAIATSATQTVECGLLLSSIGYRGEPLADLPFDNKAGTYKNVEGRIEGEPGLFTAGWIKRGPSGIIGTNKACSNETVGHVVAHLHQVAQPGTRRGFAGVRDLLQTTVVSFDDWRRLDEIEIDDGQKLGKPREKILDFSTAIDGL